MYQLKYLKITTLPQSSRNKWRSPVEQFTESEEVNHEEIPQEICDDEAEVSQKTPNENTREIQTQKKTQKCLEIPHCKEKP